MRKFFETLVLILISILLIVCLFLAFPYVLDTYMILALDYIPFCGGGYVPGISESFR